MIQTQRPYSTGKTGSILRRLACMVVPLIAMFFSSCAATDPEYAQKMALARTDWKGNEVAGIWVAKFHHLGPLSVRVTLLLRPEGTGQMIQRAPAGNHIVHDITWHYSGNGVWEGSAKTVQSFIGDPDYRIVAHYNGRELLYEMHVPDLFREAVVKVLLVPADDAAAVQEHLSRR